MASLIGTGRCPIGCGSTKARYTVSAKQLAVATCNACNCQVFARSDRSDEVLRANIVAGQAEADPAPAPVAAPAPAPIVAAPPPAPEVKPPARRYGWGIFAGQEVR